MDINQPAGKTTLLTTSIILCEVFTLSVRGPGFDRMLSYFFFFFCGRSAVLRPSVHMLSGTAWCGASVPLSPAVCGCLVLRPWLLSPLASEAKKKKKKKRKKKKKNCLFALTSQQHASVSQGRICSDNFTCCHTEIEVADQTFHLTQSQYTDTWPTSPNTDPITPGAWQGSHWSTNF